MRSARIGAPPVRGKGISHPFGSLSHIEPSSRLKSADVGQQWRKVHALESHRKEAKRWLNALRSGDAHALTRFTAVHPHPPMTPRLRDVQFALARELGFPGWNELKQECLARPSRDAGHARLVDWFLENACPDLRRDEAAARQLVATHPEYLTDSTALFEATRRNDIHTMGFLFDLGISPNLDTSDHTSALHIAARAGSLEAARLLVACGAEVDRVETTWGGTPLGSATYSGEQPLIDFLARYTRDIWCLTFNGKVDRVHEILADDASLARASEDGSSLLFWLPRDDESRAIELARVLLSHGADPSIKGTDGRTAADRAERLAMFDLARVLSAQAG